MAFINPLWGIPFIGIILSMSFLPLFCKNFWLKYGGYVPLFWSVVYLFFVYCFFDISSVVSATLEPIITDYVSFIVLISTLYIISGSVYVNFPRGRGPVFNTIFLFSGSLISGWIGTTGASALLIRPFLRANLGRKHTVHLVVFFIFLVSNIGGVATPLGDPPLFIGFIKGIDFFWFIKRLYPFLFATLITLCLLFFVIDYVLFRIDGEIYCSNDNNSIFEIRGWRNIILIIVTLLVVIFCNFDGYFILYGEKICYSSVFRNFLLIAISLISFNITPAEIREKNSFSFEPMKEIAELFAGIFITVTPIINILHQGEGGAFGGAFRFMTSNGDFVASRCFWVSGLMSSILDNAPTFLIFFHLTSGDPGILMSVKSNILMAFSISTVFMGAMTYIGNAPNLIVRSVAVDRGITVPSFLGYIGWSSVILLPILMIISCFL